MNVSRYLSSILQIWKQKLVYRITDYVERVSNQFLSFYRMFCHLFALNILIKIMIVLLIQQRDKDQKY